MTAKEFIRLTNLDIRGVNTTRPLGICGDGLEISIQASRFHYCIPKESPTSEDFEYENVEVGFQNHLKVWGWQRKYSRQEWDNPDPCAINCLYGYVSIQDLEKFVKKHGGISSIERGNDLL